MQVLGILEGRSALGVAEIQGRLKQNGNDLAYTTVMTVLVRLQAKGFIKRKKEGRQYLYFVGEKETPSSRLFAKVRKSLFQNERLRPILALLDDSEELTAEELKELRRAVDKRLKETQS